MKLQLHFYLQTSRLKTYTCSSQSKSNSHFSCFYYFRPIRAGSTFPMESEKSSRNMTTQAVTSILELQQFLYYKRLDSPEICKCHEYYQMKGVESTLPATVGSNMQFKSTYFSEVVTNLLISESCKSSHLANKGPW